MRKSYVLFVLLIVGSMLFSACATQTPVEPVKETVVVLETQVVKQTEIVAGTPVVKEVVITATPAPVVEEPPAEEVALNPYLGSNMLDGNGIPPTFFDDVHIRKAFAYCFDWETLINDVYQGEAVQSKVLSLPGMPGYDPDAPFYSMDLDKCAEEFKLADVDKDGVPAGEDPDDVWEMGFRVQMLYNTGNTVREIIAEILQADLAEVNDKFVVEVLGLPWPAYLAAQRAYKIPIMTGGWLEDIHDAHNWYQPYTTGSYGNRQNMPADLKAQFKALLDEGVSLVDPAARHAVYQRFNQLYYDTIPGFPLVLATSHGYEQKWVEGRIMNPIFSNIYYRTISKTSAAPDPTTMVVAVIGDADTFDPALSYDTASGEIIQNVYETLVFYDGEATDKFVPQLATDWTVSDDGTVWTFNIRQGVKFQEGGDLTPSDVAYSFQRGLLQGGYSSPQWLLAEPFLGVGNDDITMIVDEGASADDREALMANDPATLKAACEKVQSAIVADDAAGTVTFTLAQAWGPFLATIANGWGSVMDKEWVIENGGWDGSCDTWQDFYGMTSAEDPFTPIANGTGAFKLDHWTPGEEIVLAKNENYWGEAAKLDRVAIKIIPEFGTRFAMLQAGEADIINVPADYRVQVDPMVGEIMIYDAATNTYLPAVPVCSVNTDVKGLDRFTTCDTPSDQPLRLYFGRPGLAQDVVLFNFDIH
jgi:ABC-type transport system substrate-binding protein